MGNSNRRSEPAHVLSAVCLLAGSVTNWHPNTVNSMSLSPSPAPKFGDCYSDEMHLRAHLQTLLASVGLLACTSAGRQDECTARQWLGTATVARRTTLDDVKPKYLSMVQIASIPDGAQPGVVAWIDEEVTRVRAKAQPQDEVWYFREEKCPGCGWYREGYALVRGCTVVDEITLRDDM